jgi:hypothetical protein
VDDADSGADLSAGGNIAPVAKLGFTIAGLVAGSTVAPEQLQAAALSFGVSAGLLDYILDVPQRAIRKVKVATDEAAGLYGDAEALMARVVSDERLLWQFDATVSAASTAATDQKAKALGRALAEGALAVDDAAIDQAGMMTRILADLETIDVRVLARLTDLKLGRNVPPAAQLADERRPAHLYFEDLAELTRLDQLALLGPVNVLRRHGLIMDLIGGRGGWYATALGVRIIEYLRAAA